MKNKYSSLSLRKKRHLRLRKKIMGTSERPRLNIFVSNQHFFVQIIDDQKQITLCSAHSRDIEAKLVNKEVAGHIGTLIAQKALKKGINCVVFDRGGFLYHGRIKALTENARKEGLKF
ncbi:50S ribosomal protein L18 [Texas Phoenix palm phytoplasma]|uniref:Large ribosomal subunit protein uL18 n=1 Tax=Texas Phoenix palm phytoplasma TaxID=176709 RepID=A0ABS5BIJ5_9MOLU|nr:50S ribosomal protein L18 [Texas Phoenix palm phytoplasma]MBP3059403.1 50S ribosomal protein L18 [Texas Phoenix palm phytoplasma]